MEYTMGDLGEDSFTCIARGVNLVQSALNMLHGGQKSFRLGWSQGGRTC